ncbi:hypothetical protein SCHPADRAFT_10124 [Schizopora paradoxa]|uniref:Uncharacterized protein n=1 Tax=Schizopora paradoxa TaxID=27342 RepID=A0A0H2S8F3_9AGAM|nr:hypothetical protein SCHPADRAFT_10124 [Schizopora paradoxa]
MMAMKIENISNDPQFKDIPRPTLESIIATNELVNSLSGNGLAKKDLLFVPDTLSITRFDDAGASAADVRKLLSAEQSSEFRVFVRAAQDLASANTCASVLAGQGSEGDEYGDVGLLLGAAKAIEEAKDAEGRAKAALAMLGMEHVLSQASDASTPVRDFCLPTSFKCKPSDSLLATFKAARSKLGLASPFAFSVDCSSLQGGVVLHVLLGRIQPASGPEGTKGSATSAASNQTASSILRSLEVSRRRDSGNQSRCFLNCSRFPSGRRNGASTCFPLFLLALLLLPATYQITNVSYTLTRTIHEFTSRSSDALHTLQLWSSISFEIPSHLEAGFDSSTIGDHLASYFISPPIVTLSAQCLCRHSKQVKGTFPRFDVQNFILGIPAANAYSHLLCRYRPWRVQKGINNLKRYKYI